MKIILGAVGLLGWSALTSSAATYLESVDGDLSDDHLAPTPIVLEPGSNVLSGSLIGGGSDLDLFTLSVPDGLEISAVRVLEFTGGGDGGSFLGIQPGTTLSHFPDGDFAGAIGFTIISPDDGAADADVIDRILLGPPFFSAGSLPAGDYAGWLNETGGSSDYEVDFVVTPIPEPSALGFVVLAAATGLAFSRRSDR